MSVPTDPLLSRPECECGTPMGGSLAVLECPRCLAEAAHSDTEADFVAWATSTSVEELDKMVDNLLADPAAVTRRWMLDTIADWLLKERKAEVAAEREKEGRPR